MQSRTFIRASPSVCRMGKAACQPLTRNMSHLPVSFLPRFTGGSDFAPLFRLLDDYTSPPVSRAFEAAWSNPLAPRNAAPQAIYQPRFDVTEAEAAYELRGELPGVDPKDVEVAFTDAQTLVIKGRTERESSSESNPAAVTAADAEKPAAVEEANNDNEDAASNFSSSSYQQATVEDEDAAGPSTAAPTPATDAAAAEEVAQQQQQVPEPRYWVSERSTGSFERTFRFQTRVDQDGVTASLKNGILSLVIPKAAKPEARRIAIQ